MKEAKNEAVKMEKEKGVKGRGGRPAKAVKKQVLLSVRLSRAEHFVVREKAKRAGATLSQYARELVVSGVVSARLSEEERHFVRQLVGMANNLNQIAKRCHQEGALKALVFFEQYRSAIDHVLKYFSHGE